MDFGEDKAIMENNADWLRQLNYLNFMREYGVHFSVNRMLAMDSYKNRLETGLTFFEFGYLLLQSYDFLELNRRYNCKLQIGGSDQWSNIIGGMELIRKTEQKQAYAMTFKLLTTADGKKMGKSQKGAVWLDEEKTTHTLFGVTYMVIAPEHLFVSKFTTAEQKEVVTTSSICLRIC